MKISLVMLTMNRREVVERSLEHNLNNAGFPLHELIHVDNGSDDQDWFRDKFKPDVQILNRVNLGVSKGYNRGMVLSTGSHILITGCDRLMPDNWLAKMANCFDKVPHTGVVSVYTSPTELKMNDRTRGHVHCENGITLKLGIPFEARLHSREFLSKAGYFREDFGLYGMEDCEWAYRAERVAWENGLWNYILPELEAQHLNEDDSKPFHGWKSYREFKDAHNSEIAEHYHRVLKHGFPYYNPYK